MAHSNSFSLNRTRTGAYFNAAGEISWSQILAGKEAKPALIKAVKAAQKTFFRVYFAETKKTKTEVGR